MARKIIQTISLLTAIAVFISIGSCTSSDEKHDGHSKPVWPSPPATARIAFEQSFSTPEELGIEKGFWQWLGDFVFGADENHMVRPMDVVTIADRLIFVADPGARGIHRFDRHDNSYQFIRGLNDIELPSPVSLATDGNGNVFVTDSKLAKLFVINKGEDYARSVNLDTTVQQPTGLAIKPDNGDIYLIDTRQHQILIFSRSGKLKKRFGKHGVQEGEFNYPTHIWIEDDTVLVTDALNFRTQLFDLDGDYLSSFGKAGQSSGHQSRAKGIATDQQGHIYVVDALLNNIQLFDRSGQFLMTIGERGQLPGMFWLPAGIYISPQQKIYVADSHNRRVQIFSLIDDL